MTFVYKSARYSSASCAAVLNRFASRLNVFSSAFMYPDVSCTKSSRLQLALSSSLTASECQRTHGRNLLAQKCPGRKAAACVSRCRCIAEAASCLWARNSGRPPHHPSLKCKLALQRCLPALCSSSMRCGEQHKKSCPCHTNNLKCTRCTAPRRHRRPSPLPGMDHPTAAAATMSSHALSA